MQMYALKERYAKKRNRTANLTGDLNKRLSIEDLQVLEAFWSMDGELDSVEFETDLIVSLGAARTLNPVELV